MSIEWIEDNGVYKTKCGHFSVRIPNITIPGTNITEMMLNWNIGDCTTAPILYMSVLNINADKIKGLLEQFSDRLELLYHVLSKEIEDE